MQSFQAVAGEHQCWSGAKVQLASILSDHHGEEPATLPADEVQRSTLH